jgi:uncharacterized membrane protein
MSIQSSGAKFEHIGDTSITFDNGETVATPGVLCKFARLYSGPSRTGALLLAAARICSDGMSGRAYGLTADLTMVPVIGRPTHFTGCCSIASN